MAKDNPDSQTDLERYIDKINNTPGLSQEEKKRLRDEARQAANKNGNLTAQARDRLNKSLTTTQTAVIGNGGGGNDGGGGYSGGDGTATTKSCEEAKGAPREGYRWQGSYIINADGSVSDTCQLVPVESNQSCEEAKGPAPKGFKWQGQVVVNADGSKTDTCTLVAVEEEDPKRGSRETAKDFMRKVMESLGFSTSFGFTQQEINSLFTKMDEWIMKGYADDDQSGETLLLLFRTDKETAGMYNKRFPGMAALTARGQAISGREYISLESSYRQVLSSAGLPPKYFDSFDDYGRFIAGDVSAQEVSDRIVAAKSTANPAVLRELQQYYGIGEQDAYAFLLGLTDEKGLALDAAASARNQQTIRDISRNIQIGGYAEAAGFGMDLASASALAGTAVGQNVNPFDTRTAAELQGTFAEARRVANRETVLSGIDSQAYTEQDTLLAAFGDDQKKLESERRAARERARFGGSSGVGGGSLSQSRNL